MTDTPLLFDLPPIQEAPPKRRKRYSGEPLCARAASRVERIEERNKMLVLRYYYWTEIKRRRTDDVLHILCSQEFFVEDRTVWNAVLNYGDYLSEIARKRPSIHKLRKEHPSFAW